MLIGPCYYYRPVGWVTLNSFLVIHFNAWRLMVWVKTKWGYGLWGLSIISFEAEGINFLPWSLGFLDCIKKNVISNCGDPKIKLKATSIKEVDQWRCD